MQIFLSNRAGGGGRIGISTTVMILFMTRYMKDLKQRALNYHEKPPPGKLSVNSSKNCDTQEELSLAYTPGVAFPSLEIQKDPEKSYDYTIRGNTVGVITDGTAVLGLGNIGPLASIPVMEGKCVLLKKFAGINGIPLVINVNGSCINFINIVSSLEDNFGAINLEDIKAPECFEIEEELSKRLSIPVFHDDQHGTAVISLAGIKSSIDVVGKKIEEVIIVINGAGAAGIACARLYTAGGVRKGNIILVDTNGVIYKGRIKGMNKYKEEYAARTSKRTLEDAMAGADIFVGVSAPNILTGKMIKSMGKKPIIFALANPNPEIMPDQANRFGAAIVATGRSDFNNQINNVLGFPGIFRGTLDSRAKKINLEMKLAAVAALYDLSKERIPDDIRRVLSKAYPKDAKAGLFKKNVPLCEQFIIPKPFDPRVVSKVAKYVMKAAIEI